MLLLPANKIIASYHKGIEALMYYYQKAGVEEKHYEFFVRVKKLMYQKRKGCHCE